MILELHKYKLYLITFIVYINKIFLKIIKFNQIHVTSVL